MTPLQFSSGWENLLVEFVLVVWWEQKEERNGLPEMNHHSHSISPLAIIKSCKDMILTLQSEINSIWKTFWLLTVLLIARFSLKSDSHWWKHQCMTTEAVINTRSVVYRLTNNSLTCFQGLTTLPLLVVLQWQLGSWERASEMRVQSVCMFLCCHKKRKLSLLQLPGLSSSSVNLVLSSAVYVYM